MADDEYHIFICHASEDKERIVFPLYGELHQRHLNCWIDYREIQLGDDFRMRMDEGLARSRFGVVILSPNFFKYWTQAELSALFNQEAAFGEKRILPVRCDLDRATLTQRLPLLAARADVSWDLGLPGVADRIRDVVLGRMPSMPGKRSQVYNLPIRRTQKLFGRDPDIDNLMERLQPGKAIRLAASIEGLAGVGKTELALHLTDRLAGTGRFPGGIFWFDAEDPDLAHAWGGLVADGLAVGPGEITERAAAAVRLVSSGPPALVILDNVVKWTKSSEPRPLPEGTHVGLLATTRHRFLAGPAFDHCHLEFLPEKASREMLLAMADRDLGAAPGTDELLEHLDGHSLALELAGAYLREFSTVTPRAYLDRLKAGEAPGETVKDLVRYESTVERALDAQWAGRTGSPEEQAQALRAFVEGCADHADRIDLSTGYQVYREDGVHLELAMDRAENVLGPGDPRLGRLFDGLGTALQSLGSFRRARELLEQALASDLKNLGEEHPVVAASRSNLALVLKDLGELPRARDLLEQALAWALKNLGEEHPVVATRRSNLAVVLQALGELPRARDLKEKSLAWALKNLGEEHPVVATRRSNLALVLQALGELPRARDLLEQALASDLKNLGEEHPAVARHRSNLAGVLQDLGELPRARDLLEQALASDLKNLGEEHPAVATRWSNLAVVLQDLGELPRARDLLEQSLASDLKNLGEEHPAVARHRVNLAMTIENSGDDDAAKRMYARALAAEERSLGPDHPSTSYTRVRLAGCLARLGKPGEARIQAERALEAVGTQPAGATFRTRVEHAARKILDSK